MTQAAIKLVFAGPTGGGKTTAIHRLTETPPVVTDAQMTVGATAEKSTTTVALDYGEMTLESGDRALLFGAPGHRHYDYMCKIVARGALGIVLLLNNEDGNPELDLNYFIDLFSEHASKGSMVVGITHTEDAGDNPLRRYHNWLCGRGYSLRVFAVDARSRDDIVVLVEALPAPGSIE